MRIEMGDEQVTSKDRLPFRVFHQKLPVCSLSRLSRRSN